MPNTHLIERENVFPRRYTPAELEKIANAAGISKCGPIAQEKLQRAAEGYQWALSTDSGGIFFRSNRQRRSQLIRILKLRSDNAPAEEINKALDELDAVTSQLLKTNRPDDFHNFNRVAKRALKKLERPRRGPDPKRARLQFVADLIRIYEYAAKQRAGRNVHTEEGGKFYAAVVAALIPFNAVIGCEADITLALKGHKKASSTRKPPNSSVR